MKSILMNVGLGLAGLGLMSCSKSTTTTETSTRSIELTLPSDSVFNNGTTLTGTVEALEADGSPGKLPVQLYAGAGDLNGTGATQADVPLDAQGKGTFTYGCDADLDDRCVPGRMPLVAVWNGYLTPSFATFVYKPGPVVLTDGADWHECELSDVNVCGVWHWTAPGSAFHATWENGAIAEIGLTDNGNTIVLDRYDDAGHTTGLHAHYEGVKTSAHTLKGTVVWTDASGTRHGTWHAEW